ncbi:hypothetical protein PPUN15366_11530 [Pseudomonas putida]|uniref:hypothetical protein n=1 Tax=Pseudomonas putida TaxID=303 RepID=UPI00235C8BCE|nr:hypothetical protein [Pseudomonas putida]GLO39509.1 hypothetical protein PPUN15366_11530 [Pseudomonas putida]HDS0976137.1 hypothetical protein [Pseudomonas putida]
MGNTNAIPSTPAEHRVIELRKWGMSIEKIKNETGVPDRRIKALIEGIVKPKKAQQRKPKSLKPFDKAFERIFPLACRPSGIRDYELRDILHEEYRSTRDTSDGHYKSNYTADHIKRIKAKARERATAEGCNALFVADWIDECDPNSSNSFMISAAADLLSRIDEYVNEYMAIHGTGQGDQSENARLARRKQHYAAKEHLLKLAISGYSPEPVDTLLKRTAKLVSDLEGNPELRLIARSSTDEMKCTQPKNHAASPSIDYTDYDTWCI